MFLKIFKNIFLFKISVLQTALKNFIKSFSFLKNESERHEMKLHELHLLFHGWLDTGT